MEAHLAPKSSVQVNKITSSCEICSGPHDTQYCMENPEQAFVDYASSRTDEAGGKWYTFKPEQNNLGDTYNPSWKSHPNLRLSKFKADFKQQQGEMTNKIDTVLKAINDRITGALPSDTVKNPKLNVNSTSPVLSALDKIRTSKPKEPAKALEYEFKDLHLNLSIFEVLAHAPMYNAMLDRYVESLEPKSKNVKVRVNTEESAVKPEPELKNTVGCNLNPSDGPGKPNSISMKTVKTLKAQS
ncbi:hypothetical protein Tco_1516121 [Tanacetum coccineum]